MNKNIEEDDWNIGQERHCFKVYNSNIICDGYRVKHMKILKEKILEDIKYIAGIGSGTREYNLILSVNDVKGVLDKRFGF